MDLVTINATFGDQAQAESTVRKLRALRGDCFRIECLGASTPDDRLSSMRAEFAAESDLTGERDQRRGEVPNFDPEQLGNQSFALSANIPALAVEQARSVIREAGGRMESADSP